MSFGSKFLAIDWGTTNRRVFTIEAGRVVQTSRDGNGVTSVRDFPGEVASIRDRFGDLPMLLAGMVGSDIGWRTAPYVAAPAGIDDLVAHLMPVDERTFIVPGVSMAGRADVMRGEEVQFLGAVQAGMAPQDALLVQPGTHCKWAEMEAGRIRNFTTAMTGELFGLLRRHSLLAPQLQGDVNCGTAFLEGVEEGRKRDLSASLFGIRAATVLGQQVEAASFASGLLIGSDVAARLSVHPQDTVHILADPHLGQLYAAAIEAHGRRALRLDSHAAFAAGIHAIGERL